MTGMKSLLLHYAFYFTKLITIGYIFFRLGKKFNAPNPFWHYLVPVWNYVILCRCTQLSTGYAIGYNLLYFSASIVMYIGETLEEPGLVNIWLCLFIMAIMLEAEIFGRMAQRLNKDFWLFGFSGFAAYFPLVFLVLAKEGQQGQPPADLKPPAGKSDYPIY